MQAVSKPWPHAGVGSHGSHRRSSHLRTESFGRAKGLRLVTTLGRQKQAMRTEHEIMNSRAARQLRFFWASIAEVMNIKLTYEAQAPHGPVRHGFKSISGFDQIRVATHGGKNLLLV